MGKVRIAVCKSCGKEFEFIKTGLFEKPMCNECKIKEEEEMERMWRTQERIDAGKEYKKYAQDAGIPSCSGKSFIARQEEIFEKYESQTQREITYSWLEEKCKNKKLTEEECEEIISKLGGSLYYPAVGAAFNDHIFVSSKYKGLTVDVEDVFAIVYENKTPISGTNSDIFLYLLFTNDTYVPVFPICFLQKGNPFGIGTNKKSLKETISRLEELCPNLVYPVLKGKDFIKMIKKEENIQGNIDKEKLIDFVKYRIDKLSKFKEFRHRLHTDFTCEPEVNETFEKHEYIYSFIAGLVMRRNKKLKKYMEKKKIIL